MPAYVRRMLWRIALSSVFAASSSGVAGAEDWPQFRGPARDGQSRETGLLRQWPAGGPKVLWTVPVGQGYAGAAILGGRVYHNDYDEEKNEWGVYARSLADGKEIWRYTPAASWSAYNPMAAGSRSRACST